MSKRGRLVRQTKGMRCHGMMRAIFACALIVGCHDSTGVRSAGTQLPSLLPPTPFIVSMVPATTSDVQPGGVVFVSLPEGAMPAASVATIRNRRTSDTLSVLLIDGGFDPVSIPAQAGDTLSVAVSGAGSANPLHFVLLVVPRQPPVIVRTNPPPRKRDVPWNTIITIVFSEPVDSATVLPSTVSLNAGGTVIPGLLGFKDSSHTAVTFSPAAALGASTDYTLVIGKGIRDLGGDALDSGTTVTFTTAAAVPPPVLSFLVSQPVPSIDTGFSTFVALWPASLPSATSATVLNKRTGFSVSTLVDSGGFDPVAVRAVAGDTIAITLNSQPKSQVLQQVVPFTSLPRVMRSSPTSGQAGVKLDAAMTIVFSEPVTAASILGSTVSLHAGASLVAGQLGFTDSTHTAVTFVPAAPLSANTSYSLAVGTGIRGLRGDSLDYGATIAFTTAPALPPPPNPIADTFTISEPMAGIGPGLFTYVALPPGSFPLAASAQVRNKRSGAWNAPGRFQGGGFDPVAVQAAVGDTIEISLYSPGTSQVFERVVPAASVPQLLRTSPTAGQADVKRDATITVAFSEPLDPNSIYGSGPQPYFIQLWRAGTAVGGQLGCSTNGVCTLVADSAVALGSSYQITIDSSARSGSGVALRSSATISFTTENPPPGALLARLAGVSASIIEFQYPDLPGHWFYAPQVRVQETTGVASALVDRLQLTIPGIATNSTQCNSGVVIGAGQATDLFVKVYGDFELTFDTPGSRATGADGTVVVQFRDPAGRIDSLSLAAPIVPDSQTTPEGVGHLWSPSYGHSCPR